LRFARAIVQAPRIRQAQGRRLPRQSASGHAEASPSINRRLAEVQATRLPLQE
jgi:hypothetical protein